MRNIIDFRLLRIWVAAILFGWICYAGVSERFSLIIFFCSMPWIISLLFFRFVQYSFVNGDIMAWCKHPSNISLITLYITCNAPNTYFPKYPWIIKIEKSRVCCARRVHDQTVHTHTHTFRWLLSQRKRIRLFLVLSVVFSLLFHVWRRHFRASLCHYFIAFWTRRCGQLFGIVSIDGKTNETFASDKCARVEGMYFAHHIHIFPQSISRWITHRCPPPHSLPPTHFVSCTPTPYNLRFLLTFFSFLSLSHYVYYLCLFLIPSFLSQISNSQTHTICSSLSDKLHLLLIQRFINHFCARVISTNIQCFRYASGVSQSKDYSPRSRTESIRYDIPLVY